MSVGGRNPDSEWLGGGVGSSFVVESHRRIPFPGCSSGWDFGILRGDDAWLVITRMPTKKPFPTAIESTGVR